MDTPEGGEWSLTSTREHLAALIREADRRHEQRSELQDKAVAAALAAAERAVEAALAAAKEAVAKAEIASEKRFEGVNEFRATLSDQATTFITRAEVDARLLALTEKVNEALSRTDNINAREGGVTASWGYLIQAVLIAVAIISVIVAVTR